jgi:hypothetical protein
MIDIKNSWVIGGGVAILALVLLRSSGGNTSAPAQDNTLPLAALQTNAALTPQILNAQLGFQQNNLNAASQNNAASTQLLSDTISGVLANQGNLITTSTMVQNDLAKTVLNLNSPQAIPLAKINANTQVQLAQTAANQNITLANINSAAQQQIATINNNAASSNMLANNIFGSINNLGGLALLRGG